MTAQAEEYREKLMDEVAENSDELLERYLEGEEIYHEELVTTLKKGVTEGHLFPVTCGVATKNLGTNRLLEALVEDLPSPAMRGAIKAVGRGRGEDGDRAPTPTESWVTYVFKTPRRPLHGPASTCFGSLGNAEERLPGGERDPAREGADRPARRAARQGMDPGRRPRAGRHRRDREAKETRAGDVLAWKDAKSRSPPLELRRP